MKILCHVGPWCEEQYKTIASGVDASSDVTITSGFRAVDHSGLVDNYYKYFKKNEFEVVSEENGAQYTDIIQRCRLLRSLKKNDALRHLLAMQKSVEEMFDSISPDLVISETVDQYLMDLIYFESKKRGIPFVGLVVSFVNGYYRISARGEHTHLREPKDNEVDYLISTLQKRSYKPDVVKESVDYIISLAYKRWLKNALRIPYFMLKRYLTNERYNYHYWASELTAINNFDWFPNFNIGEDNWHEKLISSNKPVIYVPLQMFPEATIDYWCDVIENIDYENRLVEYIAVLSVDFQILIKEHPYVIGARSPGLYKRLSEIGGLITCPVYENSNTLVNLCDAVMVWTGSVGFEAALRGKPVLTVCEPYYVCGAQFLRLTSKISSAEILTFIKEQTKVLNNNEKQRIVKHILSGLLPGKYINDASWLRGNPQDVLDAKKIGAQIRQYICHL